MQLCVGLPRFLVIISYMRGAVLPTRMLSTSVVLNPEVAEEGMNKKNCKIMVEGASVRIYHVLFYFQQLKRACNAVQKFCTAEAKLRDEQFYSVSL